MLTPVFILSLFSNHSYGHPIALVIFIIASITDAYDGYHARKYNQETPEGKFLVKNKVPATSSDIPYLSVSDIAL